MRLERSKEWWISRALSEPIGAVGAGRDLDNEAIPADEVAPVVEPDEAVVVFGKFVSLMRRKRGWSVEDLAQKSQVSPGELIKLEEHLVAPIEPRTVFQLAKVFDVALPRLMQLAGLAVAKDADSFQQEAIRFAARSEPMQELTKEETKALEDFVRVLGQPNATV